MSDTYVIIYVVCFSLAPPMAYWVYPCGQVGALLWVGFLILSSVVCNNPSDFGLIDKVEYNEGISNQLWFFNTIWNAFWTFVGDRLSKKDMNKIS
jgi:hypothetical protein